MRHLPFPHTKTPSMGVLLLNQCVLWVSALLADTSNNPSTHPSIHLSIYHSFISHQKKKPIILLPDSSNYLCLPSPSCISTFAWLLSPLLPPAVILNLNLSPCARAHARTHAHTLSVHAGAAISACPSAIHHHFICLNWMPSGPLILSISPLTNSSSLRAQSRHTPYPKLDFLPLPPCLSSSFFSPHPFLSPSLVKEWEKDGDGVAERFIRWKVMV